MKLDTFSQLIIINEWYDFHHQKNLKQQNKLNISPDGSGISSIFFEVVFVAGIKRPEQALIHALQIPEKKSENKADSRN
jgi:hypothetical protein